MEVYGEKWHKKFTPNSCEGIWKK